MLRGFLSGQPFTGLRIAAAARRLQGHHSRSQLPRAALQLLRKRTTTAPMATHAWCKSCYANRSNKAAFCAVCGGKLSTYVAAKTNTSSYTAPSSVVPWKTERWESPRRRSSPRRRWQPDKPAQTEGPKEPEKGKGKGKRTEVVAPHTRQLPKPPLAREPPAPREPGPAPTQQEGTEDSRLLEALMPHIKAEDLPEQLRGLIKQKEQSNVKSDAKHLHRLVARRSEAKRNLAALRDERANYEQSWSKYAGDLMKILQEQWDQRDSTLQNLDSKEQEWMTQLAEATKELKAAAKDKTEVHASDSEPMSDTEVDRTAETDAKVVAKRAELTTSHQKLQEALAGVKAAAEAGAERERTPRRGTKRDVVTVEDEDKESKAATANKALKEDGKQPF